MMARRAPSPPVGDSAAESVSVRSVVGETTCPTAAVSGCESHLLDLQSLQKIWADRLAIADNTISSFAPGSRDRRIS